jgi:membrane-associated phospholipid phosphatase
MYPASSIPLFVVRCQGLFRRTAVAYVAVIAVSLACFKVYPVTSMGLRAPLTVLDMARTSDWLVAKLYSVDPPDNLFPSLHFSISLLAAISTWKANRFYGTLVYISLVPVALSVCTVKQHFLADVVAGFALATLLGLLIIVPYRAHPSVERSYTWHGPAIYLCFLGLFYIVIYIAYVSSFVSETIPK